MPKEITTIESLNHRQRNRVGDHGHFLLRSTSLISYLCLMAEENRLRLNAENGSSIARCVKI